MTPTPVSTPAGTTAPGTSTSTQQRELGGGPPSVVSLPRLYALRAGYLVIAVGLALTKWPLFLHHPQPWPLIDGVETSMLVALSLLWFLGIRYPLQMLPVLLFELAWKIIWTVGVVLPLWRAGQLDAATLGVFYTCLVVIIPAAVIPWRHVVTHYVIERGDRWR